MLMSKSNYQKMITLLVLILSFTVSKLNATIIYVNAGNNSGTKNGQAWGTAYTSINDALSVVKSGDEIWVAAGTYKPTTGTDRDASFNLVEGVALLGGFDGTESSSGDRDWETNLTVLSGDIGTANNNSDNVYHVVVGANDATLDGFTIQDGNADFPNDGSGCLVETPNTDVEILRIVTNVKSISGAGLLNLHASTATKNCTFKNNQASKGGAVYNMVTTYWDMNGTTNTGDSPTFENCIFTGNSATARGGAVNSDFMTTPSYINCQFIGNHCDSKGGAVYSDMGCPSYFINVLFAKNTAERGAGLVADGSSSHRLAYCTFINNTVEDIGAALYQGTYMGESMTSGNAFSGNEVHLYNSLVIGNSSGSSSNSLSNWHDDEVTYDANSIVETEDGTLTLSDYVSTSDYSSKSSTYGWQPDRSINTTTLLSTLKSDENNSFLSYSYSTTAANGTAKTIYVKADATSGGDGSSWASAENDLQDALEAATSGSEIWVAAGTYKPTTGTDREAAFVMKEGVSIYGGFDGSTDTQLSDRDPATNMTVLSGDIGTQGDSTDNSYHVLFGASNATIDGFIIRRGQADGTYYNSRGAGLLCYDGNSPTVNNCTFKNNYAEEGAAIAAYYYSAPTVSNCTLSNNSAERAGAILLRVGPDTQETGAQISNTSFNNNTATDRGGAVYIDYGAWPTFTSCSFTGNIAFGNGGAVYVDNNSSQLETIQTWFDNCNFQDNESQKRGGAFAIYEGTVHFVSSTITGNTAKTGGGGIALDYLGTYDETGLTVWGNSTTTGDNDIDDGTGSGTSINLTKSDKNSMLAAYPNPTNTQTTISYHLEYANFVTLVIFNMYGQQVETLTNDYQTAGEYEVVWQANNYPRGTYLVVIQMGGNIETTKLMLTGN